MADETVGERLRNNVTELTSVIVTATWLALLFVGPGNLWLPVMLVGYIAVIPIVEILAGETDEEDESDEDLGTARTTGAERDADPLAELRRRYAEGELTDEQFERKVERLLETETIEDVEDNYTPGRGTDRERELERE